MNNEQSLEMYLQSQILKVKGLIKICEEKIERDRELFNETKLENAKIELSQSISNELRTHDHLTFRLNWLNKQHSDLKNEMIKYGINTISLNSIEE